MTLPLIIANFPIVIAMSIATDQSISFFVAWKLPITFKIWSQILPYELMDRV